MKRFFASILATTLALSSLATPFSYAADPVETDRLEVTANPTAKVGEPIDLTIKALAKDGSVVKSYEGTIFVIVENDNKAEVPYQDGYKFVVGDQGQKTFSKALKFTKEGTLKVVASDFDKPKIEGSFKVKVSASGDAPTTTGTESVTITSPDNNSTLGNSNFSVVGATKKSSKVQLFINNVKALEGQSDEKGAFVFEVKNTNQVKNILSVKVLDGTDKVIGESPKVTVSAGSEGPEFKNIKLSTPTALSGSKVGVTIEATPGLKTVTVSAGSALVTIPESAVAGIYSGDIIAPSEAGATPVDVSLKNDLGKETLKAAATTLTVTAPVVMYKNIKSEVLGSKVTFTFEVENAPADLSKFELSYTKVTPAPLVTSVSTIPTSTGSGADTAAEFMAALDQVTTAAASGSRASTTPPAVTGGATRAVSATPIATPTKVLTYETARIKNGSGAFVWYVSNLDIALYNFTISGVRADGSMIAGSTSPVIPVDLSLASAGKCIINNIAGLTLKKGADASILSWAAIPEATKYNIYKKNAAGEFVFVESTTKNSYTIFLASGPVKFEEFSVKAVCADATESAKFAPSTRVQTGPAQLFLFLSLALAAAYMITRRKTQK
jgi:hypothetical protein